MTSPRADFLDWPRPAIVRPTSPDVTMRVCPRGWVCHAERAPGSKVTWPPLTRAALTNLEHRVHTNRTERYASGPLAEGRDPLRLKSIIFLHSVASVSSRCAMDTTAIVAMPCRAGRRRSMHEALSVAAAASRPRKKIAQEPCDERAVAPREAIPQDELQANSSASSRDQVGCAGTTLVQRMCRRSSMAGQSAPKRSMTFRGYPRWALLPAGRQRSPKVKVFLQFPTRCLGLAPWREKLAERTIAR